MNRWVLWYTRRKSALRTQLLTTMRKWCEYFLTFSLFRIKPHLIGRNKIFALEFWQSYRHLNHFLFSHDSPIRRKVWLKVSGLRRTENKNSLQVIYYRNHTRPLLCKLSGFDHFRPFPTSQIWPCHREELIITTLEADHPMPIQVF